VKDRTRLELTQRGRAEKKIRVIRERVLMSSTALGRHEYKAESESTERKVKGAETGE